MYCTKILETNIQIFVCHIYRSEKCTFFPALIYTEHFGVESWISKLLNCSTVLELSNISWIAVWYIFLPIVTILIVSLVVMSASGQHGRTLYLRAMFCHNWLWFITRRIRDKYETELKEVERSERATLEKFNNMKVMFVNVLMESPCMLTDNM